jgi:predicted nuclease of predicted toxin-antitoxin system
MVDCALRPLADSSYVFDSARGAPDVDVLALARAEHRILITEDYDFGALIFGELRPPPPGLVHLVLHGMSKAERDAKFAAEAAALLAAAPGYFVVFSRSTIRVRPFPGAPP